LALLPTRARSTRIWRQSSFGQQPMFDARDHAAASRLTYRGDGPRVSLVGPAVCDERSSIRPIGQRWGCRRAEAVRSNGQLATRAEILNSKRQANAGKIGRSRDLELTTPRDPTDAHDQRFEPNFRSLPQAGVSKQDLLRLSRPATTVAGGRREVE
jgi:hypothetical protein